MQLTQTIQEPSRKKAQNTMDLRVFARIPDEYRNELKAHTNFALRHTICKQLSIPIADIPDVHHIATGLAQTYVYTMVIMMSSRSLAKRSRYGTVSDPHHTSRVHRKTCFRLELGPTLMVSKTERRDVDL
ncbi:hypothetical protein B0J13DRAFT_571804 [Dactylonectria estremocensis]|uniref:Uncharacterized protein n=1 Tax=Dactylonectria estremocensis TaxID=1079267 RepID=A0A9P9DAT5_9HYPO|nr:hypothetical protein B0J13DRAFT_571804 [Dactylonectria estremocensis]